jgi:hypothetical protein
MMLSEAIDAVSRMLRGYANGGASAGKSYIGALAELLCSYPRQVAFACAEPLTGVVTTTKFLPTPADIVGWCEPRVQAMHATAKREEQWAEQLRDREKFDHERTPVVDPVPAWCRANLFVPSSAPKFSAMVRMAEQAEPRNSHRTADGIWIPLDWYDQAAAAPRWQPFNKADLEAMYARADAQVAQQREAAE